ncbi:MAG: FAD-dependent oxidoreductase [Planctomycetes bacterium]|nr:FAD-dependent oxidoreductase [Planctomycetota bacterium]
MERSELGSEQRPLRVAVIGSGPSAFYAVEALFKTERLHCRVDVFDRLPTPFGLVRGGVAPDHQKIKSVTRIYEALAADPRFRFFGNVMLGRDVRVGDLDALYDRVIYAVGNEGDRRLDIAGEDADGVHSATAFVGWYNGHPDFAGLSFGLDRAERAIVVGNGNVAIDVTRVLLRAADELAVTDIADEALATLRASTVREVVLLGRRGPAQAAFSPKEIQEIAALDGVEVVVDPVDAALEPVSEQWLETAAPKSARRNVEFLQGCPVEPRDPGARVVRCVFRASPVEIVPDPGTGRVRRVRVQRNELRPAADGTPRPRGLDEWFDIDAQLVFRAVGYRGVPIDGVPFDERAGVIPNADGRVLREPGGNVMPGHYVVGWAKRGPTGLIGTNSPDSKATVAALVADLTGVTAAPLSSDEVEAMPRLLRSRGVRYVDYDDWCRYDAWERAEGARSGRVRAKLTSVDAILAQMDALRGAS